MNKLLIKAETILKAPIDTIKVETLLMDIKYNRLLLIHDQFDKIIPFSNSKRLSEISASVKLIELNKIGHYRMLWSPEVHEAIHKELIINTNDSKIIKRNKSNLVTT